MIAIKTETAKVYECVGKDLLVIPESKEGRVRLLSKDDPSEEAVRYRRLIEEKRRNGN
jgi:hypothetical protein